MLRSRFWSGLTQRMKDATRHKYDMIQDFDQLRREARIIEQEYKLTDKKEGQQKAQVKMSVTSEGETGVSSVRRLKGMMHKLAEEVHAIQKQIVGKDQKVNGREMKQPPDGYGQGLGAGYGRDGGRGDRWQQHPQMRPLQRRQRQSGFFPQDQGPRYIPSPLRPVGQNHLGPCGQTQDSRLLEGNVCFICQEHGHIHQDCPRQFEPTCWYCERIGHRQRNCLELTLLGPTAAGRTVGHIYQSSSDSPPGIPSHMIGRENECHVLLEGVRCNSLLDTGSTVSTASHRFSQEYLSTLRLYPLHNILKVESA